MGVLGCADYDGDMQEMLSAKPKQTTLLWVFGLAFVGGVLLAKAAGALDPGYLAFLPITMLLGARYARAAVVAVIIVGILLGMVRVGNWSSDVQRVEALYGQEVVVEGRIVTDATYNNRSQTEFEIDNIVCLLYTSPSPRDA